MFGKITEFAIEVNRITVLVLIAIPVIGFLNFLDYPRQEDPSIEIREAIVITSFPGMDVYEVEDLITFKVEEKVREIGEVDDIWSYSKTGVSIVHLELDDWVQGLGSVQAVLCTHKDLVKIDRLQIGGAPLLAVSIGIGYAPSVYKD